MAQVRFLDGEQAGRSVTVDDAALPSEGIYRFPQQDGAGPATGHGDAYYLKRVPVERGSTQPETDWTAALDDNPPDD